MPLGTEIGDIVLDGDPALPPQKGDRAPSPIFGLCLYCGQTAGWIKVALERFGLFCVCVVIGVRDWGENCNEGAD